MLLNLVIGCIGLVLSGHAFTRFSDTHYLNPVRKTWLVTGVGEVLTGVYFIVAAIGNANNVLLTL